MREWRLCTEFAAAIARRTFPLLLRLPRPAMVPVGFARALLAAVDSRSTRLRNGLGKFSSSAGSYRGVGGTAAFTVA